MQTLNVQRLSVRWTFLAMLLLMAVVPTIPQDLATKPSWYVPLVDVEQILTCIGVLLYALDVRKVSVITLWRALFPLLILAEGANLIYGFSHIDSYPSPNDSSPVQLILSILLVYTVFVVPAFYANYAFAYRRLDRL